MKLINKTQHIYLVLVVVLLLVWSGLFLWAISMAIQENIDETLHSELLTLLEQSQNQNSIQAISTQQMEVHPIGQVRDTTVSFSDTTLFNSIEHEVFPYRQVNVQTRVAGNAYQITLRRSLVEYDDLFETILVMEFIFIVLLIGGLFFINKNILQQLWSPFYDTLQKVTDYELGHKGRIEWHTSDIDEFEQLNSVLGEMIAQIEQEYESLKSFTENASHEIQTPLSSIVNRVEIMLQDEGLAKDKWKHLQQIQQTARKLSRLNKALLLLTKIENRQYSHNKEASISQILHSLCNEYRDLASSKNIEMDCKIEQDMKARINAELADMMIRNLLSNAVKHNHKDGHIWVSLEENKLIISNTGDAVEGDPEHFFDRFKKGASYANSLGLGLSIVATIAKVNNLELSYTYENGIHSLRILFPDPDKLD